MSLKTDIIRLFKYALRVVFGAMTPDSAVLNHADTMAESAIQALEAEPWIKLLSDSDYLVRAGAAESLGEIGGAAALDALDAALQDSHEYVRECVARALEGFGKVRSIH